MSQATARIGEATVKLTKAALLDIGKILVACLCSVAIYAYGFGRNQEADAAAHAALVKDIADTNAGILERKNEREKQIETLRTDLKAVGTSNEAAHLRIESLLLQTAKDTEKIKGKLGI
jgi:hypothetical protein